MTLQLDPDSFGFVVTDLARLLRAEMDRRIADAGLGVTPGEARALSHAARTGMARQTVIAERMGVEAMTVSGYLDRLEEKGLIQRLPDPSDRRAKLVSLTDQAGNVLDAIRLISVGVRDDIADAASPLEWDQLNAALRRLRDQLATLRSDRTSDAA